MKELTEAQWAAFHELVDELDPLDSAERLRRFESMRASATADAEVLEWVGDWLVSPVGSAVASTEDAPLRDIDLPGGGYDILGLLEAGGMGEVYRARDRELDREVAIKVVRPRAGLHDPAAAHRFLREARIAANLEHPSIVPVHEAGSTTDGRVFFVMKLVRGTTLAELVERRDSGAPDAPVVPLRRQVEIMLRLCDALIYAHSRGVLHRDLKPENVMVGEFGEVQLMDWGIARAASAAADEGAGARPPDGVAATSEGAILGTPAYLSPEQACGTVDAIDVRTDVFGLGAIAYHLFSGRRPYSGRDRDQVIGKAARGELDDPWFRESKQRVPRELQAICRKALDREPGRRYSTVEELSIDMQAHLDAKPVSAAPPGLLARAWKLVRRRPAAAAVLGLVALFSPALSYAWFELRSAAEGQQKLREIRFRDSVRDFVMVEPNDDNPVAKLRDHSGAALALAELLHEWGIDLDGNAPPSAVATRISQLPPQPRSDVVGALYSIARHLSMSGLAHASFFGNHEDVLQGRDAEYSLMRARYPRPVSLWPRVCAVLTALSDQELGARCLAALERWLALHVDTLDVEDDEWRSASTEQLNFIAFVVERVHGYDAAVTILQRAVDSAPDDLLSHYRLALISLRAGHFDVALQHGWAALALWPQSKGALNVLASAYDIEAGRRANAGDESGADAAVAHSIELNRRSVELDANFVQGWHNLGIALKHAGLWDEAIAALEKERTLVPEDFTVDATLGDAYEQRHMEHGAPEDLAAAETCYRREIGHAPKWWGGHYQLGALLKRRGEIDAAIASYREALSLDPGTTEVHLDLATLLSFARRHAEAAEVAVARLETARAGSSEQEVLDLVTLAQTCIPVVTDRELRESLRSRLAAVSR